MHTFTDARGRPWSLELNCDAIERVKTDCGANLLDLADPDSDVTAELNAFPPLLCKLMFSALAEQAKTKEVDEQEFRRSMNGDAVADAGDALLDEIVLFYRKRRPHLQTVLEKNREVEKAAGNLAMTRLNDPRLMERVLAELDRKLGAQLDEALSVVSRPLPVAEDDGPLTTDAPLATGSSPSAGTPPAFSVFPAPDLTPGDNSSGSPTAPGGPTPGS